MNYPFANGRIAAIDNYILDRTKLAKLAKVPKKEFNAALVDLGYGEEASGNLEDLINFELLATKSLVDEISPQKFFTDLFFLENDAINIKTIYKMKIFGYKNIDTFKSLGIFSRNELEDIILSGNTFTLSKELKKFFNVINEKITNVDNPRLISAIIDNALYGYILDVLKKNTNPILKEYFQARIDTTNILIIIRAKKLNWDQSQTSEMFLDGGLIPKSKILNAVIKSNITRTFTDYYQGRLDSGLSRYKENGKIERLEAYFDELILSIISVHQFDAFSIGPIIYYFLKKLAEAKNIRMIYANEEIEINNLLQY
jgi:V/A-type H+-transporting ATPase subunit C